MYEQTPAIVFNLNNTLHHLKMPVFLSFHQLEALFISH